MFTKNKEGSKTLKKTALLAGVVKYTNCICQGGVRLSYNECPDYDIKQSDGEAPVMLKLLEMQSTPSLPLLSGPPKSRVREQESYL